MMYRPTVKIPPDNAPVSRDEAKDHLELPQSSTSHDNKVQGYLDAATEYCQDWQFRTYFTSTLEFTYPRWPESYAGQWNGPCSGGGFILPRATPLQSVVSIIWKDRDGNATTLDPSRYIVDTDSEPGRVVLASDQSWPSESLYPVSPIRIRYVAGHGAEDPPIPFSAAIKQGILFLVGHLFANRESVSIGTLMESKEMVHGLTMFLGLQQEPNNF